MFILSIYISPSGNANNVIAELYGAISELQSKHPDCIFFAAGEFNHTNLRIVLTKFQQHVDFPTRREIILDSVNANIIGAYQAEPLPHVVRSDHILVLLIPAYQPLVKCTKPSLKETRTWPEEVMSALQDCFEHTA